MIKSSPGTSNLIKRQIDALVERMQYASRAENPTLKAMEIRPIREIPVSSANVSKSALWVRYRAQFEVLFVFVLAAVVRLTSLGVFRAVDEEDRWAWAVDFYQALLADNLPATLVGDGYPGIFPAWLETLWLFSVSVYRSILQGSWIGEAGVDLLVHEWGRSSHLVAQRFPVVLFNTL
jgi:hypothetical protein